MEAVVDEVDGAVGVEAGDVLGADVGRLAAQAVGRVGEPEGAVGLYGEVVRRVELFAVVFGGEDFGRAVVVPADDVAACVLAGDEVAVEVEEVAVGGLDVLELGDAVFRGPLHLDRVGDVGEDEAVFRGDPDRAFGEGHAGAELAGLGVGGDDRRQVGVGEGCGEERCGGRGEGEWAEGAGGIHGGR